MEIRVGSKVRSIAGRDKGYDFLVLKADTQYAYVADGRLRKVENPKKKKLKHLQASSAVSVNIAEKLAAASEVTNAEVRKALAEFNS
ncbi:MAG: KOW domain-containing RNA-binding protein [Oscillospiraceae bacterium]|nr:KOW domain-containing RNA-binding protein [Oscillospiraceae bacterium]